MISVLLIDDEPALLEIGKLFLERPGDLAVTTAGSAQEAAAMIEENQFDAIVTDYAMPDVEGAELIRKIRILCADTPVIVLSGQPRDKIAGDCLCAGADAVLQKGGDPVAKYGDLHRMIAGNVRCRSDAFQE
ncbi:response regulator [Methanoculleus sp. FWC-SCC1]|uniref:Response regulator n=1 Tax=Methanoculleus frigidifontis TaxID=2584085 RepID=A0ABT8M969_9EURY|nr:response regulator [Methanoculleus sp. FWC-SCC1]MDN7024489.1 response regulator [Methanoculleus sp. FWC-SCC1]